VAEERKVEQPWGISKEDEETIAALPGQEASPADPHSASLRLEDSKNGKEGTSRQAKQSRPSDAKIQANSANGSASNLNNDPGETTSRLTHVTPSGEAHMVDVGAKAATRRVAIAFGYVRFANPEPFKLIFENNNNKGDVLGVARVAGIMGAKRTSDLVPLCHPIPISKVEVDVKLVAPNTHSTIWSDNTYGLVSVQAQVECTGPTGVEMEALTAVSAASLTVYDMCKAVDRSMQIRETVLVYKSGGRSGTFVLRRWATFVGDHYDESFLKERGLEIPPPSRRGKLREKNGRNSPPREEAGMISKPEQ
jgi:molybdenum cofactor biosynthesis protein MoaC